MGKTFTLILLNMEGRVDNPSKGPFVLNGIVKHEGWVDDQAKGWYQTKILLEYEGERESSRPCLTLPEGREATFQGIREEVVVTLV